MVRTFHVNSYLYYRFICDIYHDNYNNNNDNNVNNTDICANTEMYLLNMYIEDMKGKTTIRINLAKNIITLPWIYYLIIVLF